MSMTMTKADGVTVFTVTSNPKSSLPLFCQILGTLCCSPFYYVSGSLKQQMGSSQTVLGTLQIIVGVTNMAFGGIVRALVWFTIFWDASFWMGAVFIAAGIVCILVNRFPSPCLTFFSILMNLASFGVAVTAIVFHSIELDDFMWNYRCEPPSNSYNPYRYRYDVTTQGPITMSFNMENCERYRNMLKMLYGGLNIMMIVLAVLLLCVTLSSCVLSVKALCKKYKEDKVDPELQKPLLEEVLSSPTC